MAMVQQCFSQHCSPYHCVIRCRQKTEAIMIIVSVGLPVVLEKSLVALGTVRSCSFFTNLERELSISDKGASAVVINTDVSDVSVVVPKKIRDLGFTGAIVGLATPSDDPGSRGISAINHEVSFLKSGGDRLIWKPYSPELVASVIGAVVRRTCVTRGMESCNSFANNKDTIDLWDGKFRMDAQLHTVKLNRISVRLTRMEFKILFHLASRPGVVSSRTKLLEVGGSGDVNYRSVDTRVKRIRDKFRELVPKGDRMIQTVNSLGYRCAEECPF